MTVTGPTHSDCAEVALSVLDSLKGRDERPERIDDALSVLSHRRRRVTIEVMRTHEDTLTLADLAEEVTSRLTGRPIVDVDAETVAEVYISLYHDHLPRLVEAGLLEYDQDRDLVSPAAF